MQSRKFYSAKISGITVTQLHIYMYGKCSHKQFHSVTLLRLRVLKLRDRILLVLLQSSPRLLNKPRAVEELFFLRKSALNCTQEEKNPQTNIQTIFINNILKIQDLHRAGASNSKCAIEWTPFLGIQTSRLLSSNPSHAI